MREWYTGTVRRQLECIHRGRFEFRTQDRVLLHPRGHADVLDLVLDGKTAIIESIEQGLEGRIYVAVTIEDDPGRDPGAAGQAAHCFFFSPEEVEPVS